MTLRACRRFLVLSLALTRCIFDYWSLRMRGSLSLAQRALWLQSSCRKVLSSLRIESSVLGNPPMRGLVVSNHLSYLDVIVLAAAMPCSFVAKSEIAGWPVFGRAARAGGTIFLVRTSRSNAISVAAEIERRLALLLPVLLFPEGTSSDGSRVLRFHSRLIDPAVVASAPITPVALRYSAPGSDERELCWFGDTGFLPHLWKTLGARGVQAEVRFGARRIYSDRRTAARETHAEVVALRMEGAAQTRRDSA
ncbi:MAG TPA: lysophospholipid acyltransferase family protein [Terracidiphilus sp.]|nr:lysophospholipid acyltransferase family protein [Terracidiphilus sp.]